MQRKRARETWNNQHGLLVALNSGFGRDMTEQLVGEQLLCKQGVTGSIPVTSTKLCTYIFSRRFISFGWRAHRSRQPYFPRLRNIYAKPGRLFDRFLAEGKEIEYVRGAEFQFAQQVGPQHVFAAGFCARTKALINLSRIWGATASASMPAALRNSLASSML
jgi:hypothetical protein